MSIILKYRIAKEKKEKIEPSIMLNWTLKRPCTSTTQNLENNMEEASPSKSWSTIGIGSIELDASASPMEEIMDFTK